MVKNNCWSSHWFVLVKVFLAANESPEKVVRKEVKEEIRCISAIIELCWSLSFFKYNQLLIIYHVQIDKRAAIILQADEKVLMKEIQPWDSGTGHALRDWLNSKG